MANNDVEMRMRASVGEAVKELNKVAQAMTGIAEETQDAAQETKSFGDTLTDLQGPAKKVFSALTVGVTGATLAFASYEKELRNVQNISGLTDQAMEAMTDRFLALPPTLGESDDLMRGLYQTISSGITDSEEAFGVVVAGAKAAKGNLSELDQTIDGLTSVLNSWHLEASDATAVLDAMTKAVDLGKLTFGELADNIGKASAIAAAAGVSYEELLATLATLTLNGLSVEEAMTSIRAVMSNTLSPSEQVRKAMEKMGVDMSVAALKAEGLGGMMARVAEAVQGNAEATAELFPNLRALPAAMALASEKGGAQLNQTLIDISESAGKVASNFENTNRTLKASSDAMVAEWKNVGIVFGEVTSGPVQGLVDGLTGIATTLKELEDPTKNLIAGNALLLAGLAGIVLIGPKVIAGAKGIAGAFVVTGTAADGAALAVKGFNAAMGLAVIAGLALQFGINALAKHIDKVSDASNASSIRTREQAKAFQAAMRKNGARMTDFNKVLDVRIDKETDLTTALLTAMIGRVKYGKSTEQMRQIIEDYRETLAGVVETEEEAAEVVDKVTKKVVVATEKVDPFADAMLGLQGTIDANTQSLSDLAARQAEEEDFVTRNILNRLNEAIAIDGVTGAVEDLGDAMEELPTEPDPTVWQLWFDHVDDLSDYMEGSLANAITQGITGDFDNIEEVFTGLADDLSGIMRETLASAIQTSMTGGGGLFSNLSAAITDNPEMAIAGGAGMMFGGVQQGGTGGLLQAMMGGAMSGAGLGALTATPFGIVAGAIGGAIVGGLMSFFGGSDKTTSAGRIGLDFGGVTGTSGQGLPEGARGMFTQQLQQQYRDAIGGMNDILSIFGDADLFAFVDDPSIFEFSGSGGLDHFGNVFREQFLPEAMREMFEGAINQGLGSLGMSGAAIDRLWSTLEGYAGADHFQALETYLTALVQGADMIAEMDWDSLTEQAGKSGREIFREMMIGGLDDIDLMMASMSNLDPIQQAEKALEIQQLTAQAMNTQLQVIQQIEQISAGIARSLEQQREGLILGGLDERGQAEFIGDSIADIFEQLMAGNLDPNAVSGLVGDAQGYIRMLEQLMGEEGLNGRMADLFADFFGTSAFGDILDLFPEGIAAGMTGRDFLLMLIDQLGVTSEDALDESREEARVLNEAYIERLEQVNNHLLALDGTFDAFDTGTIETKDHIIELGDSATDTSTALQELATRLGSTGVGGQTVINIDPNLAPLIDLIESIVAARTGGGGSTPPPGGGGIR